MFQQITYVGYVGNEPVMRYTQDGVPVTNFNVAVNNRYTNAADESVEETMWFRTTTWRRLAETCAEFVSKGQLILVVGEMKLPHTWINQEGQAQATLEVTARTVRFLSGTQQNVQLDEAIESDNGSIDTT